MNIKYIGGIMKSRIHPKVMEKIEEIRERRAARMTDEEKLAEAEQMRKDAILHAANYAGCNGIDKLDPEDLPDEFWDEIEYFSDDEKEEALMVWVREFFVFEDFKMDTPNCGSCRGWDCGSEITKIVKKKKEKSPFPASGRCTEFRRMEFFDADGNKIEDRDVHFDVGINEIDAIFNFCGWS
jgi:hypothetical protein